MKIKYYVIVFLSFVVSGRCFAQEFEKNGLPCIAELCLGDGLAELSKIQWEVPRGIFGDPKRPLQGPIRKLSDARLELVKSVFRGDVVSSAPFLDGNFFDSSVLASLAQVTSACARHEIIGTYTTKSGNPTHVSISLIPNQVDTTIHRWTVVSINRTFPSAISNEQKTEVRSQIDERYAGYDVRKTSDARLGEGRFSWHLSFSPHTPIGFNLAIRRDFFEEGNRMKLHPACGGAKRVLID